MGEMAQYHIAQMVRRIRGKFITVPSEHVGKQVDAIKSGYYDKFMEELKALGTVDPFSDKGESDEIKKLKQLYKEREMESHAAEDSWKPESDYALLK